MKSWPALLVLLTFSNIVTARIFKGDLLKSIQDALNAKSVIGALADPNHRSGSADCDLDIQQFFDALSRRELWAARVLDSSAYFITGILHGNLANFGNYDECLRAAPPGDNNKYWSLYTLVEIMVQQKQKTSAAKSKAHNESLKIKKDGEDAEEWLTVIPLNLGICWIRSCGASAPGKAVSAILGLAEGVLTDTGFRLRVAPPLPGAETVGLPSKLSRGDWAVISICIGIAGLVLFGTLLDLAILYNRASRGKSGWQVGFLAFSAYTNCRRLIHVGPREPDALTAINGLRVFSILWVMLGHRYRFIMDLPYINKIEVLESAKDLSKQIIIGAPLSVDTFFTIGGLLNTYVFFMAMKEAKSFSVVHFLVHRYIRLTPAFAIMIAITATWFYHLNNGPIWLKVVGEARAHCQDHWWTSLLYVANYVNPNEQCMMQAWYLMADMQLHWFSLLVLIPLLRWRKAGIGCLLFLIPVSCVIAFVVTYVNKYRTPLPTGSVTNPGTVDYSMRDIYYPAHTRATSYLVGLLLGYVLYKIRFEVQNFRLGVNTVIAGWTLSTILFLVAIFSAYPLYQFDQEISPWVSALYVGFYRLAWSLSIGWIIIACGSGYGGPVNGFLSWSPFTVLGRLGYGMYLTHAAVQYFDAAAARSPEHFSDFSMIEKSLSDFIISGCFGMILSLGMESPIIALEKLFLSPGGPPRKAKGISPTRNATSRPNSVDNITLDTALEAEISEQRSQYSTNL